MTNHPFSFVIPDEVARKMTRGEYTAMRRYCRLVRRAILQSDHWQEIEEGLSELIATGYYGVARAYIATRDFAKEFFLDPAARQ